MGDGRAVSIWDKVNYDLAAKQEDAKPATPEERKTPDWLVRWKRVRWIVDLVATLFWVYVVLKLFVVDVDREIIEAVAPGADWIVDYRFFFFLALLALAALVFKTRTVFLLLGYVAVFPFVVLFYKVPKTLIKTKSWMGFFVLANVVSTLLAGFKYVVITFVLAAFATLFIVATSVDFLLVGSSIVLLTVLSLSYFRTMRFSARPSRFLSLQERAMERAIDSKQLTEMVTISEELKSTEVQVFDEKQQEAFVQAAGTSVLTHRFLLFWAFQLDQYRKSPVSFAFNAVGYVWLFLQTVAVLTLVSYALYKLDADAYTYADPPSLLTFARFVVASFSGGEIAAIQAHSDLADGLSLLSTLIAAIFLIGLGVSLFVSFRQRRHDESVNATIDRIRKQSEYFEERFRGEYEVSVAEAVRRLEQLRSAVVGIVALLTSRMPPDFERR